MRVVRRAVILALIPLVILGGISLLLHVEGEAEDARGALAGAVIAAAVAGASVVYQVESWSLAKQSGVHFALMAFTVLPAMLLSGWFPLEGPGDVLLVVGLFLAVGAVLWGVMLTVFRMAERRARSRRVSGEG